MLSYPLTTVRLQRKAQTEASEVCSPTACVRYPRATHPPISIPGFRFKIPHMGHGQQSNLYTHRKDQTRSRHQPPPRRLSDTTLSLWTRQQRVISRRHHVSDGVRATALRGAEKPSTWVQPVTSCRDPPSYVEHCCRPKKTHDCVYNTCARWGRSRAVSPAEVWLFV